MSFPRYEHYIETGNRWFERCPVHWKITRLSHISDVIDPQPDHRAPAISLGPGYPYVGIRDINDDGTVNFDTARQVDESAIASQEARFTLLDCDIIFCKVGTLGLPRIIRPHGRMALSATLVLVRVKQKVYAEFLRYALDGLTICNQIDYFSTGSTRAALGIEQIRSFAVAIPSCIQEQESIARFLKLETAKIDTLVNEQEHLITLLREKRQAVISHALTKGMDSSVPMKDSGVEWLGEVPAHWRFGAVKHFLAPRGDAIKTGPFGSHLTAAEMQGGSIKVYNQRNVIDCDFESGDNFINEEKFEELRSFETYPGDLLITTRGTIGRAAILPNDAERGILHPCLLRVQPDTTRLRTQFLRSLIQDSDLLRTQLSYLSNATTIEVIYSYTIASVVIPVPPVQEQDEILVSLAENMAELDNLTAEAQRAIELLQERRSALISAAVTGQIDVRGLVPAHEQAA